MGQWEGCGKSDDWHTPAFVFEALGCRFDLDVAAPIEGPRYVPCSRWISTGGLEKEWNGFVWMNPPFGGRNGLVPWLEKFFKHGCGVALVPDRTSAAWWQCFAPTADAILFVGGKIKFEKPDGTVGKNHANGTCLMASGGRAVDALQWASRSGLGFLMKRYAA